MSKHIIIHNCSECPYVSHSGAFGTVAHKPICTGRKKRDNLPYTIEIIRGRLTANLKPGIPTSCPLEEC